MSEQRLHDRLENLRCRTNHVTSVLCSFLPVLDVTDVCSTNSRMQMSPQIRIKGFKSDERSGHAMCPSLPIRCSGYTLSKNCRNVGSKCGGSLNEFQSADSYLATFLEGNFVGNRGKQPRSEMVEGSRFPEVRLMQCLHGKSKRTLQMFRQSSGGRNSETTWPNFVLHHLPAFWRRFASCRLVVKFFVMYLFYTNFKCI